MNHEGSLKPQVAALSTTDETESQLIEAVVQSPHYSHLNEWFDEQLAVLHNRFASFQTHRSTQAR